VNGRTQHSESRDRVAHLDRAPVTCH
jgi:hypothetical protein